MTVGVNRVVELLDEGASAPVPLVVSDDLWVAIAMAAAVNQGKDDFALSFTSLFIGLLSADSPTSVWLRGYCGQAEVDVNAILARRGVSESLLSKWRAPDGQLQYPTGPLLRTRSAQTALIEAQRIAKDASGPDEPVDIRHVIAAYVSLPNYHEADFRSFAIDRPAMARAFAPYAAHTFPAEAAFWKRFVSRVFPEPEQGPDPEPPAPVERLPRPLSGYAPDVYSKTDLLDIEREVTGLAALIASHKTPLPLSIGLFGPWGSGKTFFMRHLRRCIENFSTAAAESKKPQADVAYFKHVVQIEFNAWHYSEGKLLASLVEHILQNLRTTDQETPEAVEARRALILQKLEPKRAERGATEERVRAAQERVDEKQQEVNDLQVRQQRERDALARNLSGLMVLDAMRASVALDPAADAQARQTLDRLGITSVGTAAGDVQAALGRARDELSGLGGLLIPLLRGDGRTWRLLALLLVAVAPFVVGAVAYLVLQRYGLFAAQIGDWTGRIAAFLTAGAAWLNKQTSWLAARRQELDRAKGLVDAQIQNRVAEAQAAHANQLAQRLEELERLRAEHPAAVHDRDERARQIVDLETELARTSSTFRLNEFILDRARANDYRRYLGFMALVRRDFDSLSDLIERSNQQILKGEQVTPDNDPRLNRIVLYIDDLDRCPEDRVVEVLRAVHLLLAFPLFVVVVAVDSRWLTRCLLARYPQMFGAAGKDDKDEKDDKDSQGNATPMDYLEKIFQIPLWLPSLSAKQRVDLVQALLAPSGPTAPVKEIADDTGDEHRTEQEREQAKTTLASSKAGEGDADDKKPAAKSDGASDGTSNVKGEKVENGTDSNEKARETRDAGHDGPRDEVNLNPPGLDITPHESAFVKDVGPLLCATPRALKRFANTFRLIKASLPDEELRTFANEGPTSDYRYCLYQLAVLMGMPKLSSAYLRAMDSFQDDDETRVESFAWTIAFALSERTPDDFRPNSVPTWFRDEDTEDWRRVRAWLMHPDRRAWQRVLMRDVARWAPWVARYTFTPE